MNKTAQKRFKRVMMMMTLCVMSLVANAQKTYPVTIKGSKGNLKAVIHLPKLTQQQKCPFVVIMHGFTGNKNEAMLVQIAEGLQQRGIGSVRFDFNAHGESDGRFQDMTIANEIEDCKAVIATVRNLKETDPERIGLLGHSQGGVVTGMVAGELGAGQIKAIVQLSPAGNIGDDAKKGKMLGTSFNPKNLPETLSVWRHPVGKAYLQFAMTCDMYGTAAKYKGKACVIHGTADTAVPVQFGKRFADGYANGKWVPLQNDGHGLSKHRPQMLNTVYTFFTTNL